MGTIFLWLCFLNYFLWSSKLKDSLGILNIKVKIRITASQNLKWFQYFNPLHNIYPKGPPYNWTYLVIASYPGPISTSGPQRVSLTSLLHKNSSTIWRLQFCSNKISFHTSLVVQWLRLHIPTAGGHGFDPWLVNYHPNATAAAKSLQSLPTLCQPIDGSPPGSSVHGIFQARVLEWVAIALSPQCHWVWPNQSKKIKQETSIILSMQWNIYTCVCRKKIKKKKSVSLNVPKVT